MKRVSISEARAHLPDLVDEVARDDTEVTITRHGRAVAEIHPARSPDQDGNAHPLRGQPIRVSDDFDQPLPDQWDALRVAEAPEPYGADESQP